MARADDMGGFPLSIGAGHATRAVSEGDGGGLEEAIGAADRMRLDASTRGVPTADRVGEGRPPLRAQSEIVSA